MCGAAVRPASSGFESHLAGSSEPRSVLSGGRFGKTGVECMVDPGLEVTFVRIFDRGWLSLRAKLRRELAVSCACYIPWCCCPFAFGPLPNALAFVALLPVSNDGPVASIVRSAAVCRAYPEPSRCHHLRSPGVRN